MVAHPCPKTRGLLAVAKDEWSRMSHLDVDGGYVLEIVSARPDEHRRPRRPQPMHTPFVIRPDRHVYPLLRLVFVRYSYSTENDTHMSQQQPQWRNHLYALRRMRGYRQKHVAALLGYRSTTMISRLEAGERLPPLKVALLLEIVLGARLPEIYVDLAREVPHW